ncbi:serine hydrolase [Actinoplanes sp. Pm04-4]|uniref:Serine hydrolase n=1 Tax=Paractinoplanes pyxinae TaxID=2997416 RepID=A0ABT4BFE1_9ACTN|nr:serine hydrolase domain-containing protein [Actinoplanes pyxinae]MCY1144672.1 serine hydrolase [Actinoplanes pyxinae]
MEATRFHVFTPRELIGIGLGLPPANAPGAGWSYSNTNYVILGLLIKKLTGHPYAEEISRRILRPLGLRDTYFPGRELRIRGPHLDAYMIWSDGRFRDLSVYSSTWADAAGEMVSTAADVNHFYRSLLTGRLLRPALMAQMQTTVPMVPDAPEVAGYGLGIYWLAQPCGRFWGHTGGVVGQTTSSFHSPDGNRQITEADNLFPNPNPAINQALNVFMQTAACGSAAPPNPALTRALATID